MRSRMLTSIFLGGVGWQRGGFEEGTASKKLSEIKKDPTV